MRWYKFLEATGSVLGGFSFFGLFFSSGTYEGPFTGQIIFSVLVVTAALVILVFSSWLVCFARRRRRKILLLDKVYFG